MDLNKSNIKLQLISFILIQIVFIIGVTRFQIFHLFWYVFEKLTVKKKKKKKKKKNFLNVQKLLLLKVMKQLLCIVYTLLFL